MVNSAAAKLTKKPTKRSSSQQPTKRSSKKLTKRSSSQQPTKRSSKKLTKSPSSKSAISKKYHPSYTKMIIAAVKSLPDGRAATLNFALKYVTTHYDCGEDRKHTNRYVKAAIRKGFEAGVFHKLSGLGASGSFCLPKSSLVKSFKMKKPRKTVLTRVQSSDVGPAVKTATRKTQKPAKRTTKVKKGVKKAPVKASA